MHIAIIMDGNGRWAQARNLNRQAGHRAGARAVDAVVRAAAEHHIGTLTLYAFSSDNWCRPRAEVEALFGLLRRYLITETDRCLAESIRLNVIGRRDRLPAVLRETIADSEALTAKGDKLHLRLAVDYSARHSIFQAASKFYKVTDLSSDAFSNVLAEVQRGGSTDVDLLIRTGGEQRLSDFLLWECAFAEFCFLPKRWPDFTPKDLRDKVKEFEQRERTRGGLPREVEL